MAPITDRARGLAKRLLAAAEGASVVAREGVASPQFFICESLRRPLASLAGKAGFQALLSRALTLAKAEYPRLSPVQASSEGCVEGLAKIEPRLSGKEMVQAEIALLTHLIALLSTFLGEALTLRLIRDAWPEASFDDHDSEGETTA